MESMDWRRLKTVEKKHNRLPRRRFEDATRQERIWLYYFDMSHDIVLTESEEEYRQILEMADELTLRYYPGYNLSTIASRLAKEIEKKLGKEITHRWCMTYVNEALTLFGEPVDVDKEKKRQLYIKRFNNLAIKAEEEGDFNSASRALMNASKLENFNNGTDDSLKDLLKNTEAKEIVFVSTMDELKKRADELLKQSAEDVEYEEGE